MSATVADWEAAAAAVLRKAGRLSESDADSAVWDRLTRTTYDDVRITPLGTSLEGLQTSGRPNRVGDWDVRVRTTGDNEGLLTELQTGATSVWLTLTPDTDVAAALKGVLLDVAPVVLENASVDQIRALDQLGALHPDSNLGGSVEYAVDVARLARQLGVRALVVDGLAVHEEGASDAQELGWLLAEGADALRALDEAGIEDPFALIEFRVAATDEQFPTIAKMRALRRCWARVAELSGAGDAHTRIHAVTSRAMLSAFDVHTNMLRGTVAAFAAGVGGADAVTVVPFDSPVAEASAFSRRIARNTSALLLEESHVGKVTDPAGGSYVTESLTDQLALAAWAELARLESEGADAFRDRVRSVRERREHDVATRRRPITGLSEFPNPADPAPAEDGTGDGVTRWGASFEALRAAPAMTAVFLATMGPVAAHTARSTFAANLLAAGGIGVDVAGPTTDVESVLAAYAGQAVACLAGTDGAYQSWGAELVAALKQAGARHVIIAGKPIDGVDDSAALGVDALAFLHRTREALG